MIQTSLIFETSSPINTEKFSRQCRIIYDYLKAGNTINVYKAIGMGIYHLHSRISDLRNKNNVEIFDKTIVTEKQTCKEYSLKPFL